MTVDVHTLSGAYALDALSEVEAAEFREHLRGCQACRDEVRELRSAAARMGEAESMTPPASLRARVLTAAERTPQTPPPVIALASRRRPSLRTWLVGVAAAVVLIGGGAVGINALRGNEEPVLSAGPAQVFDATDAKTVTVDTANGGKVRVAVSQEEGDMAVDTRDLPALDADHSYQLWTVHDGKAASAAVLAPDDTGAAMPLPSSGTQVALTIEPHGGSDQPTTDPIVTVDPAAV